MWRVRNYTLQIAADTAVSFAPPMSGRRPPLSDDDDDDDNLDARVDGDAVRRPSLLVLRVMERRRHTAHAGAG